MELVAVHFQQESFSREQEEISRERRGKQG